jgi:hypothetical protein
MRATGSNYDTLIRRCIEAFDQRYRDPISGLLYQVVDAHSGESFGTPRVSGTSIAAYFLAFADVELSRELYESLKQNCRSNFLGFGGVLEYPRGAVAEAGDIDSGPLIFGVGVSPSGFTVASSLIHRDADFFEELVRTVYLFGVPADNGGERPGFLMGGPLGDAIMLAMPSAGPGLVHRMER